MRAEFVVSVVMGFCVLMMGCGLVGGATPPPIGNECTNDFQKVTACLGFATGKADSPTKDCCVSVTDIKNNHPVCLCYFIQQIHSGNNPNIKNLGVQEARLLQLPSACKLNNASTAECPKLLNLPPNSPDAAIFTNSSSAAATIPGASSKPATPSGTSSPATTNGSSAGFKVTPQLAGPFPIVVAALLVFFSAFPRWLIISPF